MSNLKLLPMPSHEPMWKHPVTPVNVTELMARITKLETALEFYADEDLYARQKGRSELGSKSWANPLALEDKGSIARAALKESRGEA